MNLSGLYVYFASQFTKSQLNGFLWSWLEINFEPSEFSSVAIILFLAAQLLLVIFVYFYGAYNRRIYLKMNKFKHKNKNLSNEKSQAKSMLQSQAKSLEAAEGIEQKNQVLQQSNAELNTVISQQEKQLYQLQKSLHTLEKSVATVGKPTMFEQLNKGIDVIKQSFKK